MLMMLGNFRVRWSEFHWPSILFVSEKTKDELVLVKWATVGVQPPESDLNCAVVGGILQAGGRWERRWLTTDLHFLVYFYANFLKSHLFSVLPFWFLILRSSIESIQNFDFGMAQQVVNPDGEVLSCLHLPLFGIQPFVLLWISDHFSCLLTVAKCFPLS